MLEKLRNLDKFTEPIQHSADDNKTSSRPSVCFFHRRPGTNGRLRIQLTALAQPERVNKLLSGEGFRRVVALDFHGGIYSPNSPNFWNSSFSDVRILWSRSSGESWDLKIEYFMINWLLNIATLNTTQVKTLVGLTKLQPFGKFYSQQHLI